MIGQQMSSKKIALNAVCTAAVAGLATKMIFGDVNTVRYYDFAISAPLASASACALGSVASDVFSDQVIKRFAINNQIINSSTMAVQAGVCGAASAGVMYFGGLPTQSLLKAFGLGAVSKLSGDYLNYKITDPVNGIIGPIL